ncbi:MAG: serine/threonine protein kinase, partial [Betaproteobacteria bacterium]|nr:serine/threonine protein kinase [Betaproteobacteria bacterium]
MKEPPPERIGKYPVVREIGRGATSVVYLARDTFAGRDVAIKVIRNRAPEDTDLQRRYRRVFLNEAALTGKLLHPHILAIYDAVSDPDASYIVMEYIDGHTLQDFCDQASMLPLSKVVEIIFKCSLALAFAHRQGVIHCDIKPANILVKEGTHIKISDFGAAQYDEADHTQIKGIGSPAYMSPEQVQDRELTHQTDIYSLGVVMYQLLTGKLPHNASNRGSLLYQTVNIDPLPPSAYRKDLPPELDLVVMRAMQKKLEDRYQTWGDFSKELTFAYRNLELPADTISDTEKFDTIKALSFFVDFGDQEIWETLRITSWRKFLSEHAVKNITKPVRVYRVRTEKLEGKPPAKAAAAHKWLW